MPFARCAFMTLALAAPCLVAMAARADDIETLEPELHDVRPEDLKKVEPPPPPRPKKRKSGSPSDTPDADQSLGLPGSDDVHGSDRERDRSRERTVVAVAATYGQAAFTGDFTHDRQPEIGFLAMTWSEKPRPAAPRSFADKYLLGVSIRHFVGFEQTRPQSTGALALVPTYDFATVSLVDLSAAVCVLASLPVNVCPFVGAGVLTIRGEQTDLKLGVFPYGLQVPLRIIRFIKGMSLLVGAQFQGYSVTMQGPLAGAIREGSADAFVAFSF